MTFIGLLGEELHGIDEIKTITSRIMKFVMSFSETLPIKRTRDITELFHLDNSSINKILLILVKSNLKFADIGLDEDTKTIGIRLGFTENMKKMDSKELNTFFYNSVRHEVIHALDYIKTNGKKTKYGYTDREEYYNHEFEFNEKINEIALYIKKYGIIKYTGKKDLLDIINKISAKFATVLSTNDKLYQRLLCRLAREGFLKNDTTNNIA